MIIKTADRIILDRPHFLDAMSKKQSKKEPVEDLPYDDSDPVSILQYAGRLTGKTLDELISGGEIVIGDTHSKGRFGQILEEDYFHIPNNSLPEPDFRKVGMELKVAPMKGKGGKLTAKERMVLGIINYDEVPKKGFRIFLEKGSHILIVFYHWKENTDVHSYRILKVVDWRPTDEELRLILDDWKVIEGYILRGEADLLSERQTKYLAANTKGAGHGKDERSQPFSDRPAKQRSLSFKAPFMTALFRSHPDVNEVFFEPSLKEEDDSDTIFKGTWSEDQPFEEYVIARFDRFIGKSCQEIEEMLDIELNESSKQYYYTLTLAMLDVRGKKRVKEFEEAGIIIKTVRIKLDGRPKESMSFPAFKYEELVDQTWETSDFYSQIDHEFFIPVFQFNTSDPKNEGRKELTFRGAFFWYVPDEDFKVIQKVWEDTQASVMRMDFDHFIGSAQRRIAHVRPHGRNKKDTYPFRGGHYTKRSFWFNDSYIKEVIRENLDRSKSRKK